MFGTKLELENNPKRQKTNEVNMNGNEEKESVGILRCTAVGNLVPADICGKCEGCEKNGEFSDAGGCPALLLTGDREEVAAAVRKSGVMFENVVVVNAERFRRMEETLKKIAAVESENRRLEIVLQKTAVHEMSTEEGRGRSWLRHGEPDLCENSEDMNDIAGKAMNGGEE